jgi:hypothetical protein
MANTDINTAVLAAADVAAIKASLAAAEAKMPFIQNLTKKDRKGLRKIGPERLSFVENALQAAQNNPTILPGTFDTTKFAGHVGLFQNMTDVNTVTAQLASKTDDTRMDVGALAMSEASDVYNYIKTASKKTPGLKPLAAQAAAK